jgi:hypothetical protein
MSDRQRIERFSWGGEQGGLRQVYPDQCSHCKHLREAQGWTCDAFPQGIPAIILTNRFDHRQPYPGDHGIQFEDVDTA